MTTTTSKQLFTKAKTMIPGGVNSPVRAFNGVGGDPIYFDHGKGAYLFDVDGNCYLDYVLSWGPLILGHAEPTILENLARQAAKGLSFGAPTEQAIIMAELLCRYVPSIDSVRMVNSGTEATMTAIRLARGYTKRNKIIKFHGCYHGHVDALLVKAGSGLLTLGIPGTPGIPDAVTQDTLVARYNNLEDVRTLFQTYGDDIAAVIIEPIAGNMGCVPAQHDFLVGLRQLCDDYRSVLIFDEVISGFRVGLGGAQAYYQVTPDLTTLGKIIGGGMPVGAFGGKAEIMQCLAPVGPVYQAGTLSGNPVALAVGITMISTLANLNPYAALAEKTERLTQEMLALAKRHGVALHCNQIASMFSPFFTELTCIDDYAAVSESSTTAYARFFHGMLAQGIYLAPSAFETAFLSTAHTNDMLDSTLSAVDTVFANWSDV